MTSNIGINQNKYCIKDIFCIRKNEMDMSILSSETDFFELTLCKEMGELTYRMLFLMHWILSIQLFYLTL